MIRKHIIEGSFWTSEDVCFMANLGLKVKEKEFSRFILGEGDTYERIHDRFSNRCDSSNHSIFFEYDKEDIFSSEYCVMDSPIGGGYPQPDGARKWISDTYDISDLCWKCGISKVQVNDFKINKISKRPLWGFTSWVFDALFTTEDFYKEVFEPLGLDCRTVRKTSGKIYPGVLQLAIPVIEENLDLSMHTDRRVCPACGRVKYGAQQLYPFFPLPEHPLPHIFLTREYFGYGAASFHRIIVSKELVQILLNYKLIRLNDLIPCKRNLSDYLRTIKSFQCLTLESPKR